jgi:hypothetical protein
MIWITLLSSLLSVLLQWILSQIGKTADPTNPTTKQVNHCLYLMEQIKAAATPCGYVAIPDAETAKIDKVSNVVSNITSLL